MTTARTYTSLEVVALTGATYRQLDWWCRTGRIPGQEMVIGSGHRRQFTTRQVARVTKLVEASALVNSTLDEAVELLGP